MGQTANRRRIETQAKIRAYADRCIYCDESGISSPLTIEHMPPRGMFKKKFRLKGLEFASCKSCNEGTKAADAAVAFLARIDQFGLDTEDWKVQESFKYLKSADDGAPGFIAETLGESNVKAAYLRTRGGLLVEVMETHTGPIGQALLNVFAAKLGMAMYNEHVGSPLPMTGGVHGMWFLNSGLSIEAAHSMLSILPELGTLKMGRQSASGQFDYRYNTDDKGIVAALIHFHGNIHFFTLSMAEPATCRIPDKWPYGAFVRPGELLKRMPQRRPHIFLSPQTHARSSSLIIPSRQRSIHSQAIGSDVIIGK